MCKEMLVPSEHWENGSLRETKKIESGPILCTPVLKEKQMQERPQATEAETIGDAHRGSQSVETASVHSSHLLFFSPPPLLNILEHDLSFEETIRSC